jgi:hypothetical protein
METKLKFRIWRRQGWIKGYEEALKFFHGFANENNEDKNLILSFWEEPDGYYKIMMSTGLMDKNGIEIYVGDIVETEFKSHKERGIIKEDGNWFVDSARSRTHWEVIGNIYDNPEILKEISEVKNV